MGLLALLPECILWCSWMPLGSLNMSSFHNAFTSMFASAPFRHAQLPALAIHALPKRLLGASWTLQALLPGGLVWKIVRLWRLDRLSWPPDGRVRWPVRLRRKCYGQSLYAQPN